MVGSNFSLPILLEQLLIIVHQMKCAASWRYQQRLLCLADKHATEPRGKIGSGTSRRQQHPKNGAPRSSSAGEPSGGKNSRTSASATNVTSVAPVTLNLAGSSLKRVDFSERLRLREVRWDGTIRDSVARPPPPPAASGENATFSIPATVVDAPSSLSSFSSSSVSRPVDSFSTLTDSRALRETEIRFLNDYFVEQERPQGRIAARLTHVQVEVPGGSGHEHAKGVQRGHEVVGVRDREDRVSSRGIVGGRGAASGHGGGDGGGAAFLSRDQPVGACANMINSDSERPTVRRDGGGEWGEAAGGPSEASSGASSSRMQKIKRTLKDLPNDECEFGSYLFTSTLVFILVVCFCWFSTDSRRCSCFIETMFMAERVCILTSPWQLPTF